jgi:hypothetical protein
VRFASTHIFEQREMRKLAREIVILSSIMSYWSELAPDILNLMGYKLTDGSYLGFTRNYSRPQHSVWAFERVRTCDVVLSPVTILRLTVRGEADLRSNLRHLNTLARVCRSWFYGLDWHLVYEQIRCHLEGLRKGKLARYAPTIPRGARPSAWMHAAVCSLLAIEPRRREFIKLGDSSWYGSPEGWQQFPSFAKKCDSDRIGVPVMFTGERNLPRTQEIKFVYDLIQQMSKEEIEIMAIITPSEGHRQQELVWKYGLSCHPRLQWYWIPDEGWEKISKKTHPNALRDALSAWRDSEDALDQIREELKAFKTTRKRKRLNKKEEGEREKKRLRKE